MFGIAMNLCRCFVATPFLFDIKIIGVCFGYCNIFGRVMMIFSPIISELPEPVPMVVLTVMTLICLIGSPYISKYSKLEEEEIEKEKVNKYSR